MFENAKLRSFGVEYTVQIVIVMDRYLKFARVYFAAGKMASPARNNSGKIQQRLKRVILFYHAS